VVFAKFRANFFDTDFLKPEHPNNVIPHLPSRLYLVKKPKHEICPRFKLTKIPKVNKFVETTPLTFVY